jgi:hypothetical protein
MEVVVVVAIMLLLELELELELEAVDDTEEDRDEEDEKELIIVLHDDPALESGVVFELELTLVLDVDAVDIALLVNWLDDDDIICEELI